MQAAESELVFKEPEREVVSAPVDHAAELKPPSKPVVVETEKKVFLGARVGILLLFFASICGGNGFLTINYRGLSVEGVAYFVLALILVIVAIVLITRNQENKKRAEAETAAENAAAAASSEERYKKDYERYEKQLKSAKEDYDKAMARYNARIAESNAKYDSELSESKRRFGEACQEVQALKSTLAETKDLLAQLYANDWIFVKYRNMVAMATMYEYFASGRCSELKGADGAYNLYEQELRQNLIINKLDIINDKLEDIKDNQYVLYIEMKKTNQYLADMSSVVKDVNKSIRDIAANTASIAESSKIAAYYSETTARNVEALKFIELATG